MDTARDDGYIDPAVIEAKKLLDQDLSELAASAPDEEPVTRIDSETSES